MTTYLVLTVVVVGLVLAACLPVLRRLPWRPIAVMGAVLIVLTAVFDSAIVGFGLTVYDLEKILGVYVGAAPIEDFGYTIAAALIMPALWTVLGRTRWGTRRGAGAATGSGVDRSGAGAGRVEGGGVTGGDAQARRVGGGGT